MSVDQREIEGVAGRFFYSHVCERKCKKEGNGKAKYAKKQDDVSLLCSERN